MAELHPEMSNLIQRSWFALHVRSRHEKSVRAQLASKDHDVFLPLYSARHKWSGRWTTVSLPLFPGYVFCRFDAPQRSSVLTTSGVLDVVRSGADPAPLDDSEIDAIRIAVESPLMLEPYTGLIRGDRVIMTGGPLSGVTGTLVEIRKNYRLVLSVELLRRSVLIEIDKEWAGPCEPAKAASEAVRDAFASLK